MKLSTIRDTLSALGKSPKQSLGQNFLHDQNLARWIVDQLQLQPGEPWVELGPGLGALTQHALRQSENGLVIEKDGKLADFLRSQYPSLDVVHGDALEFDTRDLFARGPVKVVGNLPYYVSSQILLGWTAPPSPVGRLVFTLQKEMAERLSASPRTKAYGALTLLVSRQWHVHLARVLPPSVFLPAPKVESAVIKLTPRAPSELPPCDGERFRRLVRRGFNQRRKFLRKNLGDEVTDWAALCQTLSVPETVRAEELDLQQWITLTNFLEGGQTAPAQDVDSEVFDVVDDNDQVIGQATRRHVHANRLRHRAVHIFVFNRRGEIFLQRRSRWKDSHPCRWGSSASGHVEAGQTYTSTAPREVSEELGVTIVCTPLATIRASEETDWEYIELFRGECDEPLHLSLGEVEAGGFFEIAQVARWLRERPEDFTPGFRACFEAITKTGL